jgi:hypothetical protein
MSCEHVWLMGNKKVAEVIMRNTIGNFFFVGLNEFSIDDVEITDCVKLKSLTHDWNPTQFIETSESLDSRMKSIMMKYRKVICIEMV